MWALSISFKFGRIPNNGQAYLKKIEQWPSCCNCVRVPHQKVRFQNRVFCVGTVASLRFACRIRHEKLYLTNAPISAVVSVPNCAWLLQKNTYHRFFDGRYSISKTGRKVKLSPVFNNLWNERECKKPIKRSPLFKANAVRNIIGNDSVPQKSYGIYRLFPCDCHKSPFTFFVFKVPADYKRVQFLTKTDAKDI